MSQELRRALTQRPIPLSAWKVQNFKSIREADLAFAPLTILVGANSSGKTSLLQSILLVVQAAQSRSQGSTFPLNGPLVSVGAFDEVRFAHSKDALGFGGTFELSEELRHSVSRPLSGGTGELSSSQGPPPPSTVNWWVSFDGPAINEAGSADIATVEVDAHRADDEEGAQEHLQLASSRRGQGEIHADVERLRLGSLVLPVRGEFSLGFTGDLAVGAIGSFRVRGIQLKAGLPHNVVTTWQLGDAAARVWVETRMFRPFWSASRGIGLGVGLESRGSNDSLLEVMPGDDLVERWATIASGEIRDWAGLREVRPLSLPAFLAQARRPVPHDERLALRDRVDELGDAIRYRLELPDEVFLPPERPTAGLLNDVMSEVYDFFQSRVVYLGPLRQDPQVVYKTAPVGAGGFIGTKGEYLASVLHGARARQVASFREDGSPQPMLLTDAVNTWAARLEIGDTIQTRDLGRLGIQLSVQRGGIPALDLTSVGVGVSQLLPVIVTCLLTQPGSLILLEQPELHLHPGLQQKLGDFLLACARSGRQLIVETHSEYLVSRLRRWIAEDDSAELLKTLAIYFVEQREDASQFRQVPVNELGGLDNWPAGFFDQAARDSRKILEAGLSKRSRRAEQAEADDPAGE